MTHLTGEGVTDLPPIVFGVSHAVLHCCRTPQSSVKYFFIKGGAITTVCAKLFRLQTSLRGVTDIMPSELSPPVLLSLVMLFYFKSLVKDRFYQILF